MPRNVEDVETFLYRLNRTFDRHDTTFIVSSGVDGPPVAIHVTEPIVVVRVDIGQLPQQPERQNSSFRWLLERNGTDLVHTAYALEDDEIVLTSGFPLENLDLNELAAVLSDIDLALARHIKPLLALVSGADGSAAADAAADGS